MYKECRAFGTVLKAGSVETGWSSMHPEDHMESMGNHEEGEIIICTHQFRNCEDVAVWEHETEAGEARVQISLKHFLQFINSPV